MSDADLTELRPRLNEGFVPHGHAVALVAVRGTADSDGCVDLMGPDERADLDRAVTYLGERDWSNGYVGMLGLSYDGSTPWEVAAQGNDHLKTIVSVSGLSDIFHLEFRNGTTEQRMTTDNVVAGYQTYSFLSNNPSNGRSAEHTLQGALCPKAAEGMAIATPCSPANATRAGSGPSATAGPASKTTTTAQSSSCTVSRIGTSTPTRPTRGSTTSKTRATP
jgi:hypothetical protein